jgi:hypothetical protein
MGAGLLAASLWILALAMPFDQDPSGTGLAYLGIGWAMPLEGWFGCYANPFILYNIILLLTRRMAGVISTIVAMVFVTQGLFHTDLSFDAAYYAEWKYGFYLWYTSSAVLFASMGLDALTLA